MQQNILVDFDSKILLNGPLKSKKGFDQNHCTNGEETTYIKVCISLLIKSLHFNYTNLIFFTKKLSLLYQLFKSKFKKKNYHCCKKKLNDISFRKNFLCFFHFRNISKK